MNTHQQLIEHFYQSFQRRDYRSMAECYHPDATFHDAAFHLENGREIAAMWQMLCEAGKDLRIEFSGVQADERSGRAHWEAWYTFSRTGRPVHNVIDASFEFREGKIFRHRDHFSFWRWSRQSLGVTGWLLGWTPFLQNKVRETAMKGLWRFVQEERER